MKTCIQRQNNLARWPKALWLKDLQDLRNFGNVHSSLLSMYMKILHLFVFAIVDG